MDKELSQNKNHSKINYELLFQLIASLAWGISVFVYGSFELGDWLQLLAASAWTVSNLLNYFNHRKLSRS